jgi:Na+/glutamate symporter
VRQMTFQEAGRFVAIVTVLLFADVIVRAIFWGYDAAEIGGGDVAFAIGATVILMTQTRLGQFRQR